MKKADEQKIILITQKTRLEQLTYRYNTPSQVKFYIEHHGGDFSDYQKEYQVYQKAVQTAVNILDTYAKVHILEKEYISSYLFGKDDVVIVLGRDGLVANVLKYLTTQKVIGVNPDPSRWDGVLLPFTVQDLEKIIPQIDKRPVKTVTFAEAVLNDGQKLYAVNDLFIGQKTHASARYEISLDGRTENQSSSGIIVSTGMGATGWLKSILAGAQGIDRYFGWKHKAVIPQDFDWSSAYLYFNVREPFPSHSTGTEIIFGIIQRQMQIISHMPENGVIFSDGIEQDYLEFNSGAVAQIRVADRKGNLFT